MEQRFFTATHYNKDVLKKSSSGGMFTAITDVWFSEYKDKSAIYGCIMDKNLNAKHIRATNVAERDKMRGSKYISSDVSGIFKMVEEDLKKGIYVLFSGTPCQIAGLKSYLSAVKAEKNEHLLTVEVICHGVGSNRFFNDYISYLEKRYKSKAVSCNFRAKSRPGKIQDMQVEFVNGKRYTASSTKYDWFYSAYGSYILRPSCYSCKFAKKERVADISIADNWNDYNSDDGSRHGSVIITNSDFGFAWFEKASYCFDYKETSFEETHQPNMRAPSPKPQKYGEFWSIYNTENGYLKVQRFLGNNTLKGRVRSFVVDILDSLNLIGVIKSVKRLIKRLMRR